MERTPEYFFRNGFRYVKPYYKSIKTHIKGRWVGKTVIDVFSKEFNIGTRAYYEEAIKLGRVRIDDESCTADRVFQQGTREIVSNYFHCHESPVLDSDVRIVFEDDQLIVVNKPASLPSHPKASFYYNSATEILKHDRQLPEDTVLRLINRLDRPTSGILMVAKTRECCKFFQDLIQSKKLKKVYLAKTRGVFPKDPIVVDMPTGAVIPRKGIYGVITNDLLSRRPDLNETDPKPSQTRFTRLSTDGKTSIVKCEPETGRTHQIRVHLQYLGHPIDNDPLYGLPIWGACNAEELTSEKMLNSVDEYLNCRLKQRVAKRDIYTDYDDLKEKFKDTPFVLKNKAELDALKDSPNFDLLCGECHVERAVLPDVNDMVLWLHALRYSGDGFDFETEFPEWAKSVALNKSLADNDKAIYNNKSE